MAVAYQAKRLSVTTTARQAMRYCCSTSSTSAASKGGQGAAETLCRKLSALGVGESAAVSDTLDEWVKEGKAVKRADVIVSVNHLRKSKKYLHALQLHEWMQKGEFRMNNGDHARHIDLLGKTEGVDSAEKYFNSLEESEKTSKTYGALLSCYCKEKMTDKANCLFEKIKELRFNSSLNYSNIMLLYSNIGEPEKVPLLGKEMEEMSIEPNAYTYNQLINGYASMKDFDAIDGVLEKMRTKNIRPDLFTLENVATVYANAGLTNKALDTLKNLESRKKVSLGRNGFHSLINLYGQLNNLEGVHRSWESLTETFGKPTNESYLVMLFALLKLKDMDVLEKKFIEWEMNCLVYEVKLVNVMLDSYLERNMIDKANALYNRVTASRIEPNLKTLELFTNYHLKNQNIDLALKFFEIGALKESTERVKWFPNDETVKKFLKLIEEEEDEEKAEKFYGIMKQMG